MVNEPVNDSPAGDIAARRPSFVRVLQVLAMVVVVLVGVRLAAPGLGLTNVNLSDVVEPRALTGAVGVVLSGIAGFLSNLFLILMIVLFLLAEGPALMDRLRASAGTDHPQVERLARVVGVSSPESTGPPP